MLQGPVVGTCLPGHCQLHVPAQPALAALIIWYGDTDAHI